MEYLDGYIYVGSTTGHLYKVNVHSLEQSFVGRFPKEIQCIVKDSGGKLWISSYGCGVSCFDVAKGEVVRTLEKKDGLSSDNLQCICFENDSILWMGSYEGLNIYNLRIQKLGQFGMMAFRFINQPIPVGAINIISDICVIKNKALA